jgi:hypothetical protein
MCLAHQDQHLTLSRREVARKPDERLCLKRRVLIHTDSQYRESAKLTGLPFHDAERAVVGNEPRIDERFTARKRREMQ